jgi:hypothetical protein
MIPILEKKIFEIMKMEFCCSKRKLMTSVLEAFELSICVQRLQRNLFQNILMEVLKGLKSMGFLERIFLNISKAQML